jgi:hypothetical protein
MLASTTDKAADGFTGCEDFFPPVRAALLCAPVVA